MKKIIFLLFISISAWTQQPKDKNLKDRFDEKTEQAKSQKVKLDSLLKSSPVGIDTGLGLNAGATVGGKSVTPKTAVKFVTETLPDLGLKIKALRKKEKERRQKQKKYHTEYENIAIWKRVTSSGGGDRLTQVEFHILKDYQQPSAYVPEIYWFDSDNQVITKSVIKDKDKSLILHGPYKRYVGDNLIEEGNYYAGTKDGRWELYDANYILLDKSNWYRGFPAESVISYYDSAHTKIREVIPIQFGKKKGEYRMFYEAGQLMAQGQYDNDSPVGTWTEYHQYKRQRKKITRYASYWYDEETEPIVLNEWDSNGKILYERPKEKTTEN